MDINSLPNWEPEAFNLEFREGFAEATSLEYGKWCEENRNATQQDRKRAYAMISKKLKPKYPSVYELWVKSCEEEAVYKA